MSTQPTTPPGTIDAFVSPRSAKTFGKVPNQNLLLIREQVAHKTRE